MRGSILALALALVGCGSQPPCGEAAAPTVAPEPGGGGNVLIVILDDVGVEQLASYGEAPNQAPTPTLDCLANRGMRFEHAWSTPLCSPSRAALLTGRSADKTGIGSNVKEADRLDHGEITIGELASASGLRTGFVGKWHLDGWEAPGALVAPLAQGFESFRGTLGNLREPGAPDPVFSDEVDYRGYWRNVNGEVTWNRRYATTTEIDDALDFVHGVGDDPWLLVLSLHAAHVPLHRPPSRLLSEHLPDGATEDQKFRALLEAADAELGRLLRHLDPQTLADTTIIAVGDNGTSPDGVAPPGDPTRVKSTLYEGGVRVPLIVAGPHVPVPGVSEALVHLVDFLPTVAEIAGGAAAVSALEPLELDGVSFLDSMYGDDSGSPDLVATVFGPKGGTLERAIRNQRFKGIERRDGTFELFDLEADPGEFVDLMASGAAQDLDADAYAALTEFQVALADPLNVPRFDPPAPEE